MGQRFDFDDVEGLDGLDSGEAPESAQAAQPSAAAAVLDSLYQEQEQSDDVSDMDAQMAAVEERLAVAQYYRLLLNDSLFNDGSPAAQRVEKEIRKFVRGRLEVLMGVRPEIERQKAQDVFSDNEVVVLKQIAAKALEMAQKAANAATAQPSAPTLKKVAAPEPEPPAPTKPAPPARPMLRKPPTQVIKPQPGQRNGPPPRPQGARPAQPQPKVEDSRVPAQYRNDPTLTYKNGKVFVQARNGDGEPLWQYDPQTKKSAPLLKDVTLPAKPAPGSVQPLPVPSIDQSNMVMQSQADSMLGLAEKKTQQMQIGGLFAQTVVSNIVPGEGEGE